MHILWPFLLLLLSSSPAWSQRLSQGASDWYMRFRGISMVKRHFDDPIMYSYRVDSSVDHRYTITKITSIVHNPAGVTRVYRFGVVIPKTAFVSNVTLQRGVSVLRSFPEPSWDSLRTKKHIGEDDVLATQSSEDPSRPAERKKHGPNHRLFQSLRKQQDKFNSDFSDFQQFILPINLRPNENVTIHLVYEDILRRRFDILAHSLSVNPGSIVEDFQLRLCIKENRPLRNLKVTAPVIGDMSAYRVGDRNASTSTINDGHLEFVFNMSKVEQFDYFGNHGVTGEFKAEYDVEPVKGDLPDVVMEDNYFVHFYDRTKGISGSIPKHVIVLIDVSESMSGPKMNHALKSLDLLLNDLDKDDYINVLLFNSTVYEWNHSANNMGNDTFRCDDAARASIRTYLNESIFPSGKSDIVSAVSRGMELDQLLWRKSALPENAHTMFVMITDGRAPANRSEARFIRRHIRKLNNLSQIPILILGMGFDANMDFLENIAEKSNGFAENVVEDLEVEPQLTRIRTYLNDVIVKKLFLNYINPYVFDKSSLTVSKFRYFHKGGGIVVAGKFLPTAYFKPEFEVEITGQSAQGLYMEHPYTLDIFKTCCQGTIKLCSDKHLKGHCITIDNSRANLIQYAFGNKAVSLEIGGNCTWTLYDEAYYSGRNITFSPGTYNIEAIQRHVSSLKRNCIVNPEVQPPSSILNKTDNIVSRLWAFLTIKDVLSALSERPERLSPSKIDLASELSSAYHFLTPFMDLRLSPEQDSDLQVAPGDNLVEPNNETFIDNDLLTYNDLSPILSSLKDPVIARQWQSLESCHPPVKCIGNFHIEQLEGRRSNDSSPDSCGGSLTLYTKPGFEGDSHEIRYSVFQIYHRVSSQRFRSLFSEGRCCWLLFDKRFFAGNVEKVCGDSRNPLRLKNIGSIKLIRPSSSIIKK